MNCAKCKYKGTTDKGNDFCSTGNTAFINGGKDCGHYKDGIPFIQKKQIENYSTEITHEAKEYNAKLRESQKQLSDISLTGLLQSIEKLDNDTHKFVPYPIISFEDGKSFFKEIYSREVLKLKTQVLFPPETVEIIYALVAYFMGQNSALSPLKGIYLTGPPGRGKSLIMSCFKIFTDTIETKLEYSGKKFTSRKFEIESCKSIVLRVAEDKQVGSLKKHYNKNLCLGDIGAEDNYKLFGNDTNLILDILTERYDRLQSYLLITHATANMPFNGQKIRERYDARIESRAYQMFHSIVLNGPDFRIIN